MSGIGSLGLGTQQWLAERIQQLQQNLFNKIDGNGDGSLTKSEVEKAVTTAGGTTQSADALYALLDPNNTGSVSEQQFAQNLPQPRFSAPMGTQLITAQSQNSAGTNTDGPGNALVQRLFSQIDANGDGSITQSEVANAVTAAGGTVQAADALYALLDPNNTGSVSGRQFAQSVAQLLPHHHHRHHWHRDNDGDAGDASNGTRPQDALAALLGGAGSGADPTQSAQNLFSQIDANGDGSITQSELENAVTAAGGTKAAADALYAQLDPTNSGSITQAAFVQTLQPPSANGNSAQDALFALINGIDPNASVATTATAQPSSGTGTQDGQQSLVDAANGSAPSTPTSGTTAQDALAALLQASGGGWADAWTRIDPQGANGQNLASMVSMRDTLGRSHQMSQQLLGNIIDAINRNS